jgi:hypothetical protein
MLERCTRVNRLWVFWPMYTMLDLYIYIYIYIYIYLFMLFERRGVVGRTHSLPYSSSILSYKLTWYQSNNISIYHSIIFFPFYFLCYLFYSSPENGLHAHKL